MTQRHRKHITYEDIAKYFEKPLDEAAASLQISTSSLKRLCREYQIPKWPYRKVRDNCPFLYKWLDMFYTKKNCKDE